MIQFDILKWFRSFRNFQKPHYATGIYPGFGAAAQKEEEGEKKEAEREKEEEEEEDDEEKEEEGE